MNHEFIFVVFALGFMAFVFGAVAIVAIVYREGYLADKAIDGITSLARSIVIK